MRWAIFGGTFDPIHNAHLEIAKAAIKGCGLNFVLMIPAGSPPHKSGQTRTAYEHRARMVELACAYEPRLHVSRMEQGQERSYSIYTVEKLKREHPSDQIYFLIGADAFAEIETWHRWQDLVAMVEFIVVTRPGAAYDVPAGATVHALEGLQLPASSTAVREALSRGEASADVPRVVLDYARRHQLYAPASARS